MTVSELIENLRYINQEAEVICLYDGGYGSFSVEGIEIDADVNQIYLYDVLDYTPRKPE